MAKKQNKNKAKPSPEKKDVKQQAQPQPQPAPAEKVNPGIQPDEIPADAPGEKESVPLVEEQGETAQEAQAEKPQKGVRPDNKKETIVMRFPENGRVEVLSMIETKDDDIIYFITTDASLKNQSAFYEVTNCRQLAADMMKYRRQFKDPKNEAPTFYKLPFAKVPELATMLRVLKDDPHNVIAKEVEKKYQTFSMKLEKTIFDEPRMPKSQLAKAGFDIWEMEENGAFIEMENGQYTKRLYPRKEEFEGVKIEGSYAIRATQNEYSEITFEATTPQSVVQLQNDPLIAKLDKSAQAEYLAGKTLPFAIWYEGKNCFAGVNRTLNRMVYVPCSEHPAPSNIYGVAADEAKRQALGRGENVLFENCVSKDDPDNPYWGHGHFDINQMDYIIDNKHYTHPHIPKSIQDQMPAEDQKTVLEKDGYIDARNLHKQNGEKLNYMIGINPETKDIQYVSYSRYDIALREANATNRNVKEILNPTVNTTPNITNENTRKGIHM